MVLDNKLETLENVRENISYNLSEGVTNRRSDFRTFTLCSHGDYPSGRTVVLRGYDSLNNIITFHTNSHAQKINDINKCPHVSCIFYSKSLKIQIRCFGDALINHKNYRTITSWNKMNDMSKECYFQDPPPGNQIKDYNTFSKNITSGESDYFCVIDVKIQKIDWLFLKREGHRRANIFFNNKENDSWVSP